MLEKLLGLATIGSTFASVSLLHRFLSKLAVVLALVIVTAFMMGVLLIGIFYGIYEGLTYYGLTSDAAVAVVAAFAVLITTALIGLTLRHIRQLRHLPSSMNQTFPGLTHLSSIAEAFLDGFSKRAHAPKDGPHKGRN